MAEQHVREDALVLARRHKLMQLIPVFHASERNLSFILCVESNAMHTLTIAAKFPNMDVVAAMPSTSGVISLIRAGVSFSAFCIENLLKKSSSSGS